MLYAFMPQSASFYTFWNLPGIWASSCRFCVYNAVNCAETTIRYVVNLTNSTLFDSMTLFDVTLRESTWTLFWSCRNNAYYFLIAVFLISLLPYALSVFFFIVRSKHTIYRIPLFPSHFKHAH